LAVVVFAGIFQKYVQTQRGVDIGAGRILKVEGHSGGSNYFGAKRRKEIFGALSTHFSVVPNQFLMELGAQPSKLNNSNCHF